MTRSPRLSRVIPLAIFALTFLTFLPSLWNGFVDWDDFPNLVKNPHYRGLGWSQLTWMFSRNDTNFYMPLTWLTLGLDFTIWGMKPVGYHLTSLILHSLTACVFYLVVLRLLRAARGPEAVPTHALRAGAALSALLFSLHPLRVESVVWATERRDVLSGFFYLLAILAYLRSYELRHAGDFRGRAWYWGAVGAGLAALLSKPMAVSLPVVLVLLDIYPLRRLGSGRAFWLTPAARWVWLEKLPFVAFSAASCFLTMVDLGRLNDLTALPPLSVVGRLAVSCYALAFYLWKTLIPWALSPLYEQPFPLNPATWPFFLSAAFVVAFSIAAIALRRRWPMLLTAWIAYVVVLLPVLGIVQIQTIIAADRYTYLACMGWAVLAGGAFATAAEAHMRGRLNRRAGILIGSAAVVLPMVFWALTFLQTRIWRDSETLWAHAATVAPSSRAYLYWGRNLIRDGKPIEAIRPLREAVRLRPDLTAARFELGLALDAQGDLPGAIDEYREVLRASPEAFVARNNLGGALTRLGKPADAVPHLREAIRLRPGNAAARINLGIALVQTNQLDEAAELFRTALAIDPENALAHNQLGVVLIREGRWQEAGDHFREALRISPDFPEARANLARLPAEEQRRGR